MHAHSHGEGISGQKKRPDCSGRFSENDLSLGLLLLRLHRRDRGGGGGGSCLGRTLLSLDLLGEILDSLLEINEWHPTDEIAILAGGLVGKGSSIQETGLAGLGVPFDNGINLLVSDRDLCRDALEVGLFDCGLVIASSETDTGKSQEGGGDILHED
jgi:hypothetical protein